MNGHISSLDNNIGRMIKLLRLQNHWTQDKVAEQLHLSVPAFSKIETGLTTINITRLKQIAAIFNTSVDSFLNSTKALHSKEMVEEWEELQQLYAKKTQELMDLQDLAINLYEELNTKRTKKNSSSRK
jgi:transcriptional regulator with XRE-family HTH domain